MAPGGADSRVVFGLAGPPDDADLRALLRHNPLPGGITLSLEREPDFFLGATIEGDRFQTLVCRDGDAGAAVGLAGRAVLEGFLNGEARPLGYLGQLRIDTGYRGRRHILREGFLYLRTLHEADPVPLYATTIIADNAAALAALEKDRDWKPSYRRHDDFVTLALFVGRRRTAHPPAGVVLRNARAADVPALAACLQRNYARYQLAPVWTAERLASATRTRDLRPEDFLLALDGNRIIGCAALWDQQRFKQSVVRGLHGPLRWARPLYNALVPLSGFPRIPATGEPLPHAYISHIAVDDDDPDVGLALVGALREQARPRGYAYLTLALGERHPLLAPLQARFRHIVYRARAYVAHWPDGDAAYAALDDRPLHLELSTL